MRGRRLPVFATALLGWRLPVRDGLVLLRVAWFPLTVLVALDVLLAEIWNRQLEGSPYTSFADMADEAYTRLVYLDMLLALVLGGFIVALWHRVRLTGRQVLSIFGLLSAWRNIAALTVRWCGLVLITIGLMWVVSSPLGPPVSRSLSNLLIRKYGLISYPAVYRVLMDLILGAGPMLVALYVSGRLGLMLWAQPAGGAGVLDKAWAAGDGNGWRIAAAMFLAILPVTVLESAFQPGTVGGAGMMYSFLWYDAANLLQLIAAVGVIAAAHQALLGSEAAVEPASTNRTA